jgi:hypothetical protein
MANPYYDTNDPGDENFPVVPDMQLAWRDDSGRVHFSLIYRPTDEAARWDLGDEKFNALDRKQLFAIGTSHSAFSYVVLRTVGRKEVRIPTWDVYGLRHRIDFLGNTGEIEEGNSNVVGWTRRFEKGTF